MSNLNRTRHSELTPKHVLQLWSWVQRESLPCVRYYTPEITSSLDCTEVRRPEFGADHQLNVVWGLPMQWDAFKDGCIFENTKTVTLGI